MVSARNSGPRRCRKSVDDEGGWSMTVPLCTALLVVDVVEYDLVAEEDVLIAAALEGGQVVKVS